MNLYVTLDDLKNALRINSTTRDADLLLLIEDASRAIDAACDRVFYQEIVTRYYTRGDLIDDFISITSVLVDLDNDGVYETTLVADTDYITEPPNDGPITSLHIITRSTQLSGWPSQRRGIKVTGVRGYPQPDASPAGTLGAAISTVGATSATMTAGHTVKAGGTYTVDSETIYVSAVSTNTLTIVRGVNGSTAATHLNGAAVSWQPVDRVIQRATLMQCGRMWQDSANGYSGAAGSPESGGFVTSAVYPMVRDMLATRRRVESGIA